MMSTQKVVVEIHRADGLTERRAELDGFAGAMSRLRGAYDAMHQTWPVSSPPDVLVDAMQSGDRLGYHPEDAAQELAHFHQVLPEAQAAIASAGKDFQQKLEDSTRKMGGNRPADFEAQKQHRIDAMAKAQRLASEAGK